MIGEMNEGGIEGYYKKLGEKYRDKFLEVTT